MNPELTSGMQVRNSGDKLICNRVLQSEGASSFSGALNMETNTLFFSPEYAHPLWKKRLDSSAERERDLKYLLMPCSESDTWRWERMRRWEGATETNGQINMQVHFPLEAQGSLIWEKCAAIKEPNSTRSFYVNSLRNLQHFLRGASSRFNTFTSPMKSSDTANYMEMAFPLQHFRTIRP